MNCRTRRSGIPISLPGSHATIPSWLIRRLRLPAAMLTSLHNDRVKFVQKLQSQRRAREKEGRFVIEGTRLVEEAALSGSPFDFVFFSNPDYRAQTILDRLAKHAVETVEVSAQVM